MTTENLEPQKPKKQVTPTNLEPYKKEMLNQLKEAETKGFTKSRLNGKSRPKTKALKELEESGEIINLGSKGRTRYVLKEFDMPLEIGYRFPGIFIFLSAHVSFHSFIPEWTQAMPLVSLR